MRINLGSGDRYVPGWVNVDHAACPHRRDVTLDLVNGDLPWQPGQLTRVYLGHVLEHLTETACANLLFRLLPLMHPDGEILIVGPDIDVAEQMIAAGTFDFRHGHTLDGLKYGADRWGGDQHQWECTAKKVIALLERTEWPRIENVGIEKVPPVWPVADRGPRWQCAVLAGPA